MATSVAFASTPRLSGGTLSVAETSLTAPTNAVNCFAAGPSGSLAHRVRVKAAGTTTAGMIRIWYHDGSNYFLLDEIAVTAITPSGTVKSWEGESTKLGKAAPLPLPSGGSIRLATHNTETFKVLIEGGDF